MQAPHLYLISDRHATLGRPLVEVVSRALAGVAQVPGPRGAPWRIAVQLRDKDLSARELFAYAQALRQLTRNHGAQLFVNGRLDVALAVDADGLHLGQGALPAATVRLLAPAMALAVSTHSLNDVRAAKANGAAFAVFGPVFSTPSKAGILPPAGPKLLADAAALGLPIVALGGMHAETVGICMAAGASGVAGIRMLLSAPSSEAAMVGLLTKLKLGVESEFNNVNLG